MKHLSIVFLCVLSVSAWGQRRERTLVRPELSRRSGISDSAYHPASRSARVAKPTAQADAVPQAPGVLQLNLSDTDHSAWFVATETIAAGSSFIAYIAPQGGNFLKLGPYTFDRDIKPGESLLLPKISSFGDFWPVGVTTYDVVVNVNGTDTHCAADFTVGAGRTYSDLAAVQPIIYNWAESLAGRQVMLTITGWFTSEKPKVVLENLVVPPDFVTLSADKSSISVNLSQVPGAHLETYQDFLLTVAQGGFADTKVFTHVPFDPTTYDAVQ